MRASRLDVFPRLEMLFCDDNLWACWVTAAFLWSTTNQPNLTFDPSREQLSFLHTTGCVQGVSSVNRRDTVSVRKPNPRAVNTLNSSLPATDGQIENTWKYSAYITAIYWSDFTSELRWPVHPNLNTSPIFTGLFEDATLFSVWSLIISEAWLSLLWRGIVRGLFHKPLPLASLRQWCRNSHWTMRTQQGVLVVHFK